ncbi:hypothetical protein [Psychroflexus planctonicus]|uniref:Tetratricopeptide repeat protein n=1 Tax=Psychroflexus planctonicus TaxID=1526575 RepID=A0ABQ1SIF5_9FLAO|nr:hypothetical protein [Psychroflexus planctonicus]GGE41619.1 hypothetical protein GCM10010832_22090 [Psychroflexus planctonicus]
MKAFYIYFGLNLFLFTLFVNAQNQWSQYDNQPVKKVIYYNTDQSLDTINTSKTELVYYPNGLLSKSVFGNPNFEQTKYYLYEDDTLQQIITKFSEQGEIRNYVLEEVIENHKSIYPKLSKVYQEYDFFEDESSGEISTVNYTYNKNDYLIESIKHNESQDNRDYFEISEMQYKKRNIQNTFFKVFSVDQNTKDSVVDYQMKSDFKILDKEKMGPTAFQIINNQDTLYQKITYSLYDKSELKKTEINYLKWEDLLVFDVNDLAYIDLSDQGFNLLVHHFNTLNFDQANDLETIKKWEQIFATYIDQLLGDSKLDSALEASERLLKNPEHLQFESLFALNSVGYGISYDNSNWDKAKFFTNQLVQLQLEQNNTYGAKMLQARLGELEVRLNNNPKAQEILKELLEYKKELKKNTTDLSGYIEISYDELEYQVKYNDFAFQVASLYNLLGNKEQAKQILQDNLSDFARLEEAGYPADFYYKVRDKNNALLDELN